MIDVKELETTAVENTVWGDAGKGFLWGMDLNFKGYITLLSLVPIYLSVYWTETANQFAALVGCDGNDSNEWMII